MYVSPNGYLGGAERFVLNAAKGHLDQQKIKTGILFFSGGESVKEAGKLGIKYFVLVNKFRFRKPLELLRAIIEIRKIVKNFNRIRLFFFFFFFFF